jgi:hypothetical protein
MRKILCFGENNSVSIELYRAKDEFSIGLELQNDFESTIIINLALPFLFKFYLSFDTSLCKTELWRKFLLLNEENKYQGRYFSINLFPDEVAWGKDYCFILNFATYPRSSGGGFSFFKPLTEFIYGNFTCDKEIKEVWYRTVYIPGIGNYSDGTYELVIRREVRTWKWERFNKIYTHTYFDIECENGIPHSFKWGRQNGLYAISFDASNVNEAIQKLIDNIQKERKKY